jgi:hypothetical protein
VLEVVMVKAREANLWNNPMQITTGNKAFALPRSVALIKRLSEKI